MTAPNYRAMWQRQLAEANRLQQRIDGIRTALELQYPYDEAGLIHRLKAEITIMCGPNRFREIVEERQIGAFVSETDRHRHLVAEYCQGNGVDLGSGGDPVVPWAIQVDMPDEEYRTYNADRPQTAIQWRGDACHLPFQDETLDFVHSSHLLEDFEDWVPILAEWTRVLKPGGTLIIAIPDHARFRAAVAAGQGDNLNHKHESHVGELSACLPDMHTLRDDFVTNNPNEYSILYVGQKPE